MNTGIAEAKIRDSLETRYLLQDVLHSDARKTVWKVESGSLQVPYAETALVLDTSSEADHQERRYREAAFFQHPNIISLTGVSRVGTPRGDFSYFLTRLPKSTLAAQLTSSAWSLETLVEVAQQLLRGLSYIHSENLVYCALTAASTWNVGDRWQLSDFSELRIPGVEDVDQARRLMTQGLVAAPPEVYFGQISSAWDVWSFGNMLGGILRPSLKRQAAAGLPVHSISVPKQMEDLIASCSDPDPEARPTLNELQAFFQADIVADSVKQDWEQQQTQMREDPIASKLHKSGGDVSVVHDPEPIESREAPYNGSANTGTFTHEMPEPPQPGNRRELPPLPTNNMFRGMDPSRLERKRLNWPGLIAIFTVVVGLGVAYLGLGHDSFGKRASTEFTKNKASNFYR